MGRLILQGLFFTAIVCICFSADLMHANKDAKQIMLHTRSGPLNIADDSYDDEAAHNDSTQQTEQKDVGKIRAAPPQDWQSLKLLHKRETSWRGKILANVDIFKVPNIWPGKMIVYGENAEVIGVNTDIATYMAAAELGNGRLLATCHETQTNAFLDKAPTMNQQFLKNVKVWLTKGAYIGDEDICDATTLGDLSTVPSNCKIVVWVGKEEPSEGFCTNLENWVKNGGSLICGHAGWKYMEDHPDGNVWEMPVAKFLEPLGISMLSHWMSLNVDYTIDAVHEANCEKAHMGKLINSCITGVENLDITNRWLDWIFKIKLSPKALAAILQLYTNMIEIRAVSVNVIPTGSNPVDTEMGRNMTDMMNKIFVSTGQYNGQTKAPGIKDYPGDFDVLPELKTISYTASSSGRTRILPTGCYAPAGQDLVASWSGEPNTKWVVRIGSSSDWLYNGKRKSLTRWPQMNIGRYLGKSPLVIKNPFGGSVYLISPDQETETVVFQFENVVETPLYTHGMAGDWETLRTRSGFYADLVGDQIIFSMPSASIRNLADPASVMKRWDEVVLAMYDLLGHDPSGRPHWIVCDQQTSAGYMHAGYPIVTSLDVADPNNHGTSDAFLLDITHLQPGSKGQWTMFHELGHMMQDSMWTSSDVGEVTNEFFSLYIMDKFNDVNPWQIDWFLKHFVEYFTDANRPVTFDTWRWSGHVRLGTYAQIARDFGWGPFKVVFREYHALPDAERPQNDDEKVDQWITRVSRHTGKNLCPVFEFWGFPIRSSVAEAVKDLPTFLSRDETTVNLAPDRAQEMMTKYGVEELGRGATYPYTIPA